MSGKLLPRKITKSQSDKESEPDEITTAIGELESCQTELDKLNEKENEEIVAIEQNFKKLRQHHFNQRNAIIESIPDFWFNVVSFIILKIKINLQIISSCVKLSDNFYSSFSGLLL